MQTRHYTNKIPQKVQKYMKYSEMTESERTFLQGIINEYKPRKIVEIGVAAGASSLLILDAIKDTEANLYSLDYSTEYYRDLNKKTGFILENFKEYTDKWQLKTGSLSCEFLDDIGGEIDLCLLDTVHSKPGELLDYLQILPYMKKGGIIVIHDISLHTFSGFLLQDACCALFGALNGEKVIPDTTEHKFCPNIGAVKLQDNSFEHAFDIFYLLFLSWSYKIKESDYKLLHNFFSKHYDKNLLNIFEKAYSFNNKIKIASPKTFGQKIKSSRLLFYSELM